MTEQRRTPRRVRCPSCSRTWACDTSREVYVAQHTTEPDGRETCPFRGMVRTHRATAARDAFEVLAAIGARALLEGTP